MSINVLTTNLSNQFIESSNMCFYEKMDVYCNENLHNISDGIYLIKPVVATLNTGSFIAQRLFLNAFYEVRNNEICKMDSITLRQKSTFAVKLR